MPIITHVQDNFLKNTSSYQDFREPIQQWKSIGFQFHLHLCQALQWVEIFQPGVVVWVCLGQKIGVWQGLSDPNEPTWLGKSWPIARLDSSH